MIDCGLRSLIPISLISIKNCLIIGLKNIMSRFEGNIAGKHITTYVPREGKRYSSEDIGRYLSKFKLCDALHLIGKLSYEIFTSRQISIVIRNVRISNSVLAYLSMRLIERSNDYRHENMTLDNLSIAADMYLGLQDPLEIDGENGQGCLIRFGSFQLDYDREARHLLPRTLIIYEQLWNIPKNSSQVNIGAAIQSFSGLTLQEILLLSFFFSGKMQNGFFDLNENLDQYPENVRHYFDINKQKLFVEWLSCSYQEFRELSKKNMPSEVKYEKFRFNPLHTKPIIIPDRNPRPTLPQVYIAPIPTLIYEKVTRGLYFSLADHFFQNGKKNPFRGCFGDVFQEYVGLLLKKTFGEDNVKHEWNYGTKQNTKDTPDWFVIQNGSAVLIEVKQSGLYLTAKQWGDIEDIHKDLKQTIGAGVNQMWKFERDMEDGSCSVPDWFNTVSITERLVITYDRSYFLNSILRNEVINLYPSIPTTYHWHTIAVEELEYFLGIFGTKSIESLTEKRLDPELDKMDFRDYYSRKCSKDDCNNPYLDSIYDKYFSELGLPIKSQK